jgi:transposase
MQPVTAATFLGSLGDAPADEASAQLLEPAGLSLVECSSGLLEARGRVL